MSRFDVLTLGATEPKPLREVVTAMLAELNSPTNLRVVAAPRTPFVISIKKASQVYGFAPSGVLDTVRHFATHSAGDSTSQPADHLKMLSASHPR